jgi:hypothetical protein
LTLLHYKIFQKCDYSPSSYKGIFGLILLSGGFMIITIFTLYVGISLLIQGVLALRSLFMGFQVNLAKEITAIFLIVLSLVLIVLSGYLVFKFERGSGIIVYYR